MGERECRVRLADDHPVIATGIKLALKQVPGLTLQDWAEDPEAAVSLAALSQPDGIILDLVFNGTVEMELVRRCRQAAPDAALIVFTSLPGTTYEQDVLSAGADAFVGKATDLDRLVATLAALLGQPVAGSRSASGPPGATGDAVIHLTRRENEIARLLSHGMPLNEIAGRMGISPKTAAVHRDNLRKKLGCRDTNELIARLARHFGSMEGA